MAAVAMRGAEFGPAGAGDRPWSALSGFRINRPADLTVSLSHRGEIRQLDLAKIDDILGVATTAGEAVLVFSGGQAWAFTLPGHERSGGGGDGADSSILSPMPGRLIALEVGQGQEVARGQKLLTIEAMKMEHSLVAPFDGIVAELNVVEGEQVTEGALLVRIEKPGP
jgi:3-methylcrotonyl-CoA carboxylase alpha subunit